MGPLRRFSVHYSLPFLLVLMASFWPAQSEAASLTVSWTDNSTNETGFKIERRTATITTYAQIALVGANVTSYFDSGLASGTTYCYRVRAFNGAGDSDYSNEACATTVNSTPPGSTPPIAHAGPDLTVNEGALVTLSGTGSSPGGHALGFSWAQIGGPVVVLNGSNTSNPSFTAPLVGYFGALLTFQLTLTDTLGLSSTDTVGVQVSSAMTNTLTPKLVNLSNRSVAGKNDNVMIAGFVLDGTASESVLIRGLGPSLVDAGVQGVLADPVLSLFSGSEMIASNDNWQDTQAAEIAATGLDPCQPYSPNGSPPTGCQRESAIHINLNPGAYTAHLKGVGGRTGVGLADVFVLSDGGSELVNVSTRSVAGAGNEVIIAGFIIHGTDPRNVLIRGRGPSLAHFGIPDVLANPKVSLFSGSQLIASNDNWGDTQAAEIIAIGLDPCQPFTPGGPAPTGCEVEAALFVTLDPGVYTAHLSGVNSGTGVGLVEVFTLD